MNTNQDIRSRTEWKIPPNYGWLEHKLNQKEIAYIWECIGEKNKEKCNTYLAGNINSSFPLYDKNEWFYKNTVIPLIDLYNESFADYGANLAKIMHLTKKGEKMHLSLPYKMTSWWVNYQKQNEFNPIHGHSGVYSFVIWLKIPTEHEEQNDVRHGDTNSPVKSTFSFAYTNIMGDIWTSAYELGKEYEGTMLLFPSTLKHEVHPFYNCKEERISVSGNVCYSMAVQNKAEVVR